jgi:haloalkane dehalogenase
MDVYRTPDERFAELPGYPWQQRFLTTSDGLRLAALDEGPADAPVVLLLHGEPSWSYLYRKVVPPLLAAGLRVVAPDLIGFGRSDKPVRDEDYTYARHVEWLRSALFDDSTARIDGQVTLVCQDWGGLLGLRLVADDPDRFARVCTANTGLPDGSYSMGSAWQRFRSFVESHPDLPIGMLIGAGCASPPAPDVLAAYEAPFPVIESKAGARSFPGLIPQSPDQAGAAENVAAWGILETFERPWLCAFSDSDPITRGADQLFLARVPGTRGQPHTTIEGAGHFLQEDQGERLGQVIAYWIGTTS